MLTELRIRFYERRYFRACKEKQVLMFESQQAMGLDKHTAIYYREEADRWERKRAAAGRKILRLRGIDPDRKIP